MTTITNRFVEFKTMIKIPIVTDCAYLLLLVLVTSILLLKSIYCNIAHLNHENYYKFYCHKFLFWFLYIYYHKVKHSIQYFSWLQSYYKWCCIFFNSFSSSMQKRINSLFLFLRLSPSSSLKIPTSALNFG